MYVTSRRLLTVCNLCKQCNVFVADIHSHFPKAMSATMGKLEDLAKKLEGIDKQVYLQQPTGESVEELSKLKDAFAKVCSVTSKYRQFKCLSFPLSIIPHL